MTTLDDIKAAIQRLDAAELARLKAWFDEFAPSPQQPRPDAAAQAAKFGRLAGQAVANLRKGFRKP